MIERKYFQSGDSALIITFGEGISEDINKMVYHALRCIKGSDLEGILDLVPSYRSLMVLYDPLLYIYTELKEKIDSLIQDIDMDSQESKKIIEIPVLYGGQMGPDLESLAAYHGLSVEDVITLHSETLYRVYMLGFQPGFPYLGGMPSVLSTPRLSSPRQCVPKGSVGIAGNQTGIYPNDSPGGWRIIGRTPLELMDWADDKLTLIEAGEFIRFIPIDGITYEKLLKGGR